MDITDYMRFVFALGFVIGLFALLAYLAKRYGFGYRGVDKSGRRRLSISEVMPLDGKRRLVLVRRDEREHLLLIGGESDLVVEQNIDQTSPLSFQDQLDHQQAKEESA